MRTDQANRLKSSTRAKNALKKVLNTENNYVSTVAEKDGDSKNSGSSQSGSNKRNQLLAEKL